MRYSTMLALTLLVPAAAVAQDIKSGAAPAAVVTPIGGGQRLTRAQWTAMPTPPGYSAATGVRGFSSQYGSGPWWANRAIGMPDVYPRYGDIPGAWAPAATNSTREFITLEFNGAMTQEIWIFETYGVGGLYEVWDASGAVPEPLWVGVPSPVTNGEAHVFRVTVPVPRPIRALMLVTNPASVGMYPEIDAVAIVPTLAGPQLAPGGAVKN